VLIVAQNTEVKAPHSRQFRAIWAIKKQPRIAAGLFSDSDTFFQKFIILILTLFQFSRGLLS
jgi:hypothetical protein